jgi:uncharacterized protein YyaL (SSP411 family)
MEGEVFVPIGNRGWYRKHAKKAIYDQQAIEASCMVEAAAAAYRVTGQQRYLASARKIFGWFLGKNLKKVAVYDGQTGSCYDGLTPEGANLNRGAESTLSYLQACLTLKTMKQPNQTRQKAQAQILQRF